MSNEQNFMKIILYIFTGFISFLLHVSPILSYSVEYITTIEEDTIVFQFDTMHLEPLGKSFQVHEFVTEYQSKADMGGNTSVRNVSSNELKWKSQGYYMRNRDLGQLFIPKKDTWVKSIVLRTGPAESAVLYDTPGSKVFMQFFEIYGDPVINDNGTPKGTQSAHGFNTNHRTDDFIEGMDYVSLPTIFKGVFPEEIPITKDSVGNSLGNDGRLYYIRWKFENPVFFEANKRYGFIVGFLEEGLGLGFTLANANRAAMSDEPSLDDRHTPYKGGWSYRREGDGTLPPTMFPGQSPPESDSLVQRLKSESLFFPDFDRFRLSPTSDGYPDVDTYRAFEFYIEEEFMALAGIELSINELNIEVGQEYPVEAKVIPEDATKNKISWFSSNVSVAEVDSAGMIMAIGEGQAAITAFTENYTFSATCIVTVQNIATSVKDFRKNSISVFPNPVSGGMLYISSGINLLQEITIFTSEGKPVYSGKFSTSKFTIDVSHLVSGVYIIAVNSVNETTKSLFIVN